MESQYKSSCPKIYLGKVAAQGIGSLSALQKITMSIDLHYTTRHYHWTLKHVAGTSTLTGFRIFLLPIGVPSILDVLEEFYFNLTDIPGLAHPAFECMCLWMNAADPSNITGDNVVPEDVPETGEILTEGRDAGLNPGSNVVVGNGPRTVGEGVHPLVNADWGVYSRKTSHMSECLNKLRPRDHLARNFNLTAADGLSWSVEDMPCPPSEVAQRNHGDVTLSYRQDELAGTILTDARTEGGLFEILVTFY
jgi:hypothetical protein